MLNDDKPIYVRTPDTLVQALLEAVKTALWTIALACVVAAYGLAAVWSGSPGGGSVALVTSVLLALTAALTTVGVALGALAEVFDRGDTSGGWFAAADRAELETVRPRPRMVPTMIMAVITACSWFVGCAVTSSYGCDDAGGVALRIASLLLVVLTALIIIASARLGALSASLRRCWQPSHWGAALAAPAWWAGFLAVDLGLAPRLTALTDARTEAILARVFINMGLPQTTSKGWIRKHDPKTGYRTPPQIHAAAIQPPQF